MKVLLAALLLAGLALADDRLCPSGYTYSGDDSPPAGSSGSGSFAGNGGGEEGEPPAPEPRDTYVEETARSPTYSCYKLVEDADTWLSAMHRCWNDDAQLASFEDETEMSRVLSTFKSTVMRASGNDADGGIQTQFGYDVFTSGMFFHSMHKWYWVGSNNTLPKEMEVQNENTGENSIADSPRDCLVFRMKVDAESTEEDANSLALVAENCFAAKPFVCEARVQTVTYTSWFVANWVDILLGFLLVILFVALCVSLCAYSSRDSGRRSASRRRAQEQNMRRQAQAIDLPPSYNNVTLHYPTTATSMDEKPKQANRR